MTLTCFFDELVSQYHNSKLITAPYQRKDIFRVRQHTISSIAEDMFAALLFDSLENVLPGINLYFMVDYPIKPDNKGSRMFPDIAIVAEGKNPVLVSYLDLKMDLGYQRKYDVSFPMIVERVQLLRSSKITGTKTKENKDIFISPFLKWRTVVISDCNLSSAENVNYLKMEAAKNAAHFQLYFLSGRSHPNVKQRDNICTYEELPFKELIQDLQDEITQALPLINKE